MWNAYGALGKPTTTRSHTGLACGLTHPPVSDDPLGPEGCTRSKGPHFCDKTALFALSRLHSCPGTPVFLRTSFYNPLPSQAAPSTQSRPAAPLDGKRRPPLALLSNAIWHSPTRAKSTPCLPFILPRSRAYPASLPRSAPLIFKPAATPPAPTRAQPRRVFVSPPPPRLRACRPPLPGGLEAARKERWGGRLG